MDDHDQREVARRRGPLCRFRRDQSAGGDPALSAAGGARPGVWAPMPNSSSRSGASPPAALRPPPRRRSSAAPGCSRAGPGVVRRGAIRLDAAAGPRLRRAGFFHRVAGAAGARRRRGARRRARRRARSAVAAGLCMAAIVAIKPPYGLLFVGPAAYLAARRGLGAVLAAPASTGWLLPSRSPMRASWPGDFPPMSATFCRRSPPPICRCARRCAT